MIEVVGLRVQRRGQRLVEDATFVARPGRVAALLGPNGAGKSTTLRAMVGLQRPASGQALVAGVPFRRLARPACTVGCYLDVGWAHPGRTGRNHLRCLALAVDADDAAVDAVLARCGLQDAGNKRVGAYSLGMRQRLALAGALLGEPSILVLDEPFNGLDPAGHHWLRSLVVGSAREGHTVLLSSHLLGEIARIADDVVVMHDGRTVLQAPCTEFGDGRALEDEFLRLTATSSNGGVR